MPIDPVIARKGRISISALFLLNGAILGSWAPQIPLLIPPHGITESVHRLRRDAVGPHGDRRGGGTGGVPGSLHHPVRAFADGWRPCPRGRDSARDPAQGGATTRPRLSAKVLLPARIRQVPEEWISGKIWWSRGPPFRHCIP